MWIFQINLRSISGLDVPHVTISVSCSVGLVIVLTHSCPALVIALTWSFPWLGLNPSRSWYRLSLNTLQFWSWLGHGPGRMEVRDDVEKTLDFNPGNQCLCPVWDQKSTMAYHDLVWICYITSTFPEANQNICWLNLLKLQPFCNNSFFHLLIWKYRIICNADWWSQIVYKYWLQEI